MIQHIQKSKIAAEEEETLGMFKGDGTKASRESDLQMLWEKEEDRLQDRGANGRKRMPRTMMYIGAAISVLLAILFFTVHFWTDAGCGETSVCRLCKKERQSSASHQWVPATCFSPQTCRNCGETKGNALEHQWEFATCFEPQICRLCGTTGDTMEHRWQNATESAPKICMECGLREGLSLGTALTKCTMISSSNSSKRTDIITGTHISKAGITYHDSVMFWVSDAGRYYNTEHAVYRLDQKYTLLSGTIALREDSEPGAAVRFLFYDENGGLIYSTDYVSGSSAITFSVDVTDVSELRVECTTGEKCHCYGILSATVHVS